MMRQGSLGTFKTAFSLKTLFDKSFGSSLRGGHMCDVTLSCMGFTQVIEGRRRHVDSWACGRAGPDGTSEP